jgi:hypothetical protein
MSTERASFGALGGAALGAGASSFEQHLRWSAVVGAERRYGHSPLGARLHYGVRPHPVSIGRARAESERNDNSAHAVSLLFLACRWKTAHRPGRLDVR